MDPNQTPGALAAQKLFEELVKRIAANTEMLGTINANLTSFRVELGEVKASLKEFKDDLGPLIDNTGSLGDSIDDLWAMFDSGFSFLDKMSDRATKSAVGWPDVAEVVQTLRSEAAAAAAKSNSDDGEEEEEERANEIFPPRR